MAVTIETLNGLERRFNLSIPADTIEKEVTSRLQRLSRTVKMSGFRPGKVPIKMVASSYGPQVQSEVLSDAIQKAFSDVVTEQKLNVAGYPRIEPAKQAEGAANDNKFEFTATFEVYPEVKPGDLSTLSIEKPVATVDDAEIDKTLEILRKQRVEYAEVTRASQKDDRVTIDFVGKIDGVAFQGGSANDFNFVLGGGQMLPEFDAAATGLAPGAEKTFDLKFPDDYQGKEVAGKTAQFTITVKKVEEGKLPALDADFAISLGIMDGDIAKMREDVKGNLEREVKKRLQSRVKTAVMDLMYSSTQVEVPKALVEMDIERLTEQAKADLAQRGIKQDMPLPPDLFTEQAKRRVALGLILNEMVKSNHLEAKAEQVRAIVDEFAQSYEDPTEVVRWYYSDKQRLADVEALALEDNVVSFVLSKAKVTDKAVPFDELMGRNS
ncbi:MAG: tig [Betaproteobacteria bacterium]|nr:tig [Betaproteobacteria bacterium]